MATDDRKKEILKSIASDLKLSVDTREALLTLLALKDVQIDVIDELIINIDRQIPQLLKNINDNVKPVQQAYINRIEDGCRSDITWEVTETGTDVDDNDYTVYTVVKNDTRKQVNYYGQKYYRKPHNRDYGSNVIAEIVGNVADTGTGTGISTIAVTSADGIEGIGVGDIITDNLDTPTIYSVGNLPRVTGFGTTTVLGITTTIQGNIGINSDFFVAVGSGSTLAVTVGTAVSMFNILPEGTTVIGIGTATTILQFYDDQAKSFTNAQITRPAFQLSNTATSAATLQIMHVGTNNTVPTLILDKEAAKEQDEQAFVVIRDKEGIDANFDYLKSPIDPVTIGILGNQLGIGHKSEIVNNGSPKGPKQWKQVLEEPEPAIGAGTEVYWEGNLSWPISDEGGVISYATLGTTLVSTSSTLTEVTATATNTSVSPGPQADCPGKDAAITTANTNLTNAVNANLAEAQRLNDLSQALRAYRDDEEIEAWGILQSAAFEKQDADKARTDTSVFESQDLSAFDP
tara:strand:+ start:1337 stop:2887 length:1551 start_codon:yes stop_codon:yes gene_type:complete